MLQDFLDGKIAIKVTKDDFCRMREVADIIGLNFNSGDTLYGANMQRLLNQHGTITLSKLINTDSELYFNSSAIVTVPEFIFACKEKDIPVDEFMSLLEVQDAKP